MRRVTRCSRKQCGLDGAALRARAVVSIVKTHAYAFWPKGGGGGAVDLCGDLGCVGMGRRMCGAEFV